MSLSYTDIARSIVRAAREASATTHRPEAKLRELVAPLWDECLRAKRINLNFQPREERQLANGRADTVFNRLVLEYKKPGTIQSNNDENRKLISQIEGYIQDLAKEERWKEERLLGVAFDGGYFLYVQKKHGRWLPEEPEALSEKALEKFFLYLEKLTGKAALVPENLIKDFAIGGEARNYIAANAVKAFYFSLTQNVDAKVKVFFEQWALQFAEVHGSIENKKFDAETLFKSYGFKKDEQKDFDFLAFFFALDTYYGLLMKLLAYQVVGFYTLKEIAGLPLAEWEKLDSETFKDKLALLEEGGVFRSLNVRNFLEGDLLSWYLNNWNDSIERAIRAIVERLNQYDPETMELIPDETRDILKKLYQFLVPRQIRHDLGEYYTPDWLAERCLSQAGYGVKDRDLLQKRVLDPGCGSGTFLILAIKRAKEHARIFKVDPAETLSQITKNIAGFDLNPLAVISARTNYLLAVAELLKHKKGELTVPIYLCDSINPPQARIAGEMTLFEEKLPYEVKTAVGNFYFPHEVVTRQGIQTLANLMEDGVKKHQNTDAFLKKVKAELRLPDNDFDKTDAVLIGAYEKLQELEAKSINGIWARIIKNAFAPLMYQNYFDIIIGNPPWVNWESLPQEYREKTAHIWRKYDLFEHTGLRARLGSAKDDISVLMTYVSIDKYLKDKGKLCIVITQTLFKTVGGGEGFRRFRLSKNGTPFKVVQVDDMSELQPFDSATNRTAVFFCQKGEPTTYPVEYHIWKKKEKGSITIDLDWNEVLKRTSTKHLKAQSIDGSERGSWISARPKALRSLKNVVGEAAYQARAGSCTWLNGVYWGTAQTGHSGLIKFSNLNEVGKIKVVASETEIESTLVFPLLRGRDVKRWDADRAAFILVPQDPEQPSKGIPQKILKEKFPKTFDYLSRFEDQLMLRSGYRKYLRPVGEPFYSLYNIGPYTFAPYKVVWSEVGHDVEAAVVGSSSNEYLGEKVVIPDHTVVAVSLENETEAHFVCAMLNSSPAQFIVLGYVVLHPSPHILKNIKIPKYDPQNEIHQDLSRLSQQCHEKVAAGISVSDLEEQIDELAAELWGLSKEELKEIKESLEEMR